MFDSAHLRDTLVASDPDLARLRQAGRATLTAMAATAVLDVIAQLIHQPTSLAMVGIAVAMMGSVVVNDPEIRDQRITTALVPVVSSASLLAGALVSPIAWLQTATLLGIIFVAVLVRRLGPRGTALGMILFLSYFFSIFFHATLAQVPVVIAGVFVASALSYVVRFGILRERPEAGVRRRVHALRRMIAVALFELAPVAREGRWPGRRMRAMRRAMGNVNELALAIEEQCARIGPAALLPGASAAELRAHVFTLELAIEGLVAAVGRLAAPDALSKEARTALAEAISAVRAAVRVDDAHLAERATQALASLRVHACSAEASYLLVRAQGMLEDLRGAAQWTFHPQPGPHLVEEALADARLAEARRVEAEPPAAEASCAPAPPARPEWPLRMPVQATVAAALSLFAGGAVSSARAYWAVMAAWTVFTRATTLEATVARAWHRVLGTVGGVIIGLFVANAVQGHVYLELALVFSCMFVAFYTLQVAYAWMVASMTTLVAVLYSLLGRFSSDLLYLRVIETLIGAGIGAAVGTLLFPTHTRDRIRATMADALCMLGDYLDRAVVERAAERAGLLGSVREIDRKLREIRGEVQSVAAGPLLRPSRDVARIFHAFAAVFFHARHLATAGWHSPAEPVGGRIRAASARLSANARALARVLQGRDGPRVATAGPDIEAARSALTPDEARSRTPGSPAAILHWLEYVNDALLVLDREVRATGLAPRDHAQASPNVPEARRSDA